ncbi:MULTISPECIES: peptidylprolyl isomerase [unclassified Moorena]|uniref:peptidylprolyl isomerase n=1 Tax=unclassified Moorena TaxID=2683338 RepID=UPI0013FE852D|nr:MULTISPECIES: peptidylprolyl isomerase [unclassified Moorena]NEO16822.1 peptidylprolyl isomerase [Moorena sp. SIO3E8]NEQ00897.1 peptidylprolyl isomerase [Moorena sp. SIO3F7]
MSKPITITETDVIQELKLSRQMRELVEKIVKHKTIMSVVADFGIEATEEELQKAADNFRVLNHLQSSDQTWEWLRYHGLSLEDYQEMIRYNLLSGKLAEHLFKDKVEPYFYENSWDYEKVVIYEVPIDDEDLAMELFYAIQEGETSFFDVAHQHIENQELRRTGGYRGLLQRQDFIPQLSASVFAATPPQLLKPIFAGGVMRLVYVEEIIKPELDQGLRTQIMSELFEQWLESKMMSEQVTIDVGEVKV